MSDLGRHRSENDTDRPAAATELARAAPTGVTALVAREAAMISRELAADLRQETADLREETADMRQETADLRQETADLREETADLREETADLREETADLRQETADLREEAADQREETMGDEAVDRALNETQLLEANEHLVVAAIHSQTMTEAAERATLQMTFKAERDFLTGLPNRALLTDRLEQAIALAQRHRNAVALMYLDLDNFKEINDSLGHSVGDLLLQSVAKRLQGCVRSSDTVSRQGGDEFVVLLSEVQSAPDAVLAAEYIINALTEPHMLGDHRLSVTVSIGLSLYPDDGTDADEILRNADIAMYHAKRNGRDGYRSFDPEMTGRSAAGQLPVADG
jgi:diguanylate cyclase (GGDEF)-like protein